MKNTIVISLIVAVLVGGGSFFAGMKYEQSKSPSFMRTIGGAQGQGMRNTAMMGQKGNGSRAGSMRPVGGEVISTDESSITVKMEDGSSKIVLLTGDTSINKALEGIKSDLVKGEQVMVFGKTNSDGSITAQTISIGGGMMQRLPSDE